MNSTSFDLNKQDQGNEEATSESKKIPYESRELEIMKICEKLAASKFDKENVYKDIMNYLTQYNRWLYSVVSNYLFSLNEQDRSRYISNLDILLNYVDGLTIEEGTGIDIKSAIEKLWDHSNLAATQTTKLHNSDEEFFQRFQKKPYSI